MYFLLCIMQLKCSNSPLNDHPYTLQLYINQSYKIHNCWALNSPSSLYWINKQRLPYIWSQCFHFHTSIKNIISSTITTTISLFRWRKLSMFNLKAMQHVYEPHDGKECWIYSNNTYHNHNTLMEYYWWQKDPEDVINKCTTKKYCSNLSHHKNIR
jgi:hypothetical protein